MGHGGWTVREPGVRRLGSCCRCGDRAGRGAAAVPLRDRARPQLAPDRAAAGVHLLRRLAHPVGAEGPACGRGRRTAPACGPARCGRGPHGGQLLKALSPSCGVACGCLLADTRGHATRTCMGRDASRKHLMVPGVTPAGLRYAGCATASHLAGSQVMQEMRLRGCSQV